MGLFISSKQLFHLNFIIFLFLLLLSRTKNSRITRCREKEKQALVMFKEGLKDDYGLLSSWKTDDDCCEWKGVECSNRTSHVISLSLSSANNYDEEGYRIRLGGKLTPSLLELEYLTYLDLSFFNGSENVIPEFIGSLKRLKFLNLSHCNFAGEVPVQLWNLSNLLHLDLSDYQFNSSDYHHNLFAKSINGLSRLSSLRSLDLSGLYLSMAYDWTQAIDRLPFLEELKLSGCGLPGMPLTKFVPSINFTTSLSILDLSFNHFGIDLSGFDWLLLNHSTTTLTRIDISRNKLFGVIPHDFGKMQSLEYLDFSWNMLEGELTNSIGNLSTLKFLDLSHNKLNGTIPPSLLKLPKLEIFRMRYNLVQGEISELLSLSPLIELDFHSNQLTGFLTEVHLQNLSKLKHFDLSHNSIILKLNSSWVPPFNLTHLSLGNVGNCKIGPHFPSWLKNQAYLEWIDLCGCGIDDVIPNWFGYNFPQLNFLDLSDNQIHGNLPEWSSDFGSLQTIDMSSNKFQSPITSICNVSARYLDYLDLSNNLFSETIPNCLMKLNGLSYLNLGNNKFFGKLPSSIRHLTRIKSLHLRQNNLDGELPMSLQQCKMLRIIDFGQNKFMGEIPRWLGRNLQNLVILSLPSNQFEGTISSTLCHLRFLQILDLSNNGIHGNLPNCLGNLTYMKVSGVAFFAKNQDGINIVYEETASLMWKGKELVYNKNLGLVKSIDLSRNQLTGEIPREITYLDGLLALNISGNKLHGNIPQEIGRLQLLEFLDLSENQISGVIPSSLSQLHFIGVLNLSANNLSGRIPLSTQLQSFNASSYSGNPCLCGLPLSQPCPEDQHNFTSTSDRHPDVEEEEEWFDSNSFYLATGIGFVIGLWGTLGSLLINRSWRIAYFRLVSNMQDSLYISIVVKMAKLKRFFNN